MKSNSDTTRETLVSVIVPIYNVDKYLRQCVISIISQSHRNLEIILVDDGSPDDSGKIVDELASQDARIAAIHQDNSGVSVARNNGLERANGEYICFIDADDWVSPDFIEHLLTLALANEADLVLSTSVMDSKLQNGPRPETIKLMTPAEATEELLYAEIIIGCWNKLYRKSLLEKYSLRFLPQYFMGEGLNFITTFSQISTTIVSTDRSLYYYRRDNTNSATQKVSAEKYKNALAAIDNIRKNLVLGDEGVLMALEFQKWWTSFYALRAVNITGGKFLQREFYDICRNYVKDEAYRMFTRARISRRKRLLTFLTFLSPSIALFAVALRERT